MTARSAKPGAKSGAKSGVKQRCGGIFQADPDVPADQNGRQVCRCGLLGEAGDAHHTLPSVPLDVHQLRAGDQRDEGV